MPSASPSPIKRTSLSERAPSAQSLSSSGKQNTQNTAHKVHRAHVVSRHSRNVSHGKGLSKLGKINSGANIGAEGQRRKSATATPSQSPKTVAASLEKRNSSHIILPKNTSHGNLRKNHSTTTINLGRNTSHPALKKIGLPPAPKAKDKSKKHGFFELGDRSSDEEEEEGEWEDSTTTQSPELTRSNSKTSTPGRMVTPNGEQVHQRKPPDPVGLHRDKTSSPPQPSIKNHNHSAPNLRNDADVSPTYPPADPALLQHKQRSSRAPPAMSTVSAHVAPSPLTRTDSTKSFTYISHADASSANATSAAASGPGGGTSSSIDGGVSHFLSSSTPSARPNVADEESDGESSSHFFSNYKPQPSESPEKPRTLNRARAPPHLPSRTQQKLELQRREAMRAGAATPTTPPASGIGLSFGSSVSLQSRSGSRGRGRSLAGEVKAIKQDYDTAVKQLTVVKRFRNPLLESVNRLKDSGVLPADMGVAAPTGALSKSRPPSRRGPGETAINGNGLVKPTASRSFEEKKSLPLASRSSSRAQSGRVHFQRQSSHDDIEVTPSQGGPDEPEDDEQDGISPEQALIRRIWDSREVYDPTA